MSLFRAVYLISKADWKAYKHYCSPAIAKGYGKRNYGTDSLNQSKSDYTEPEAAGYLNIPLKSLSTLLDEYI